MSFFPTLGLAADVRSVTSGGQVGTWVAEFNTYDAIFTELSGGDFTVNRNRARHAVPLTYYNDQETRDNLARSIVTELRVAIQTNAGVIDRFASYGITISLSFNGEGGGITLPIRSLATLTRLGGSRALSDAINDALESALKSDETVVLDKGLKIQIKAYPVTNDEVRGGCVGELSEAWGTENKTRGLIFNPPAGYCLVSCLLYGARKEELAEKQLANWVSNSNKVHAQQASDGDLNTVLSKFNNLLNDMKTYAFTHKIETDFEDPEITIPIFLGLGHRMRIVVHPDLRDWENNEPKYYGREGDKELVIGLIGNHFVVIRKPDIFFGRATAAFSFGKRKHVPVKHAIVAVAPKARVGEEGIRGNLLVSEPAQSSCSACLRPHAECPRASLKGTVACRACGLRPKPGTCSEIHAEICDKPFTCKKCKSEFDNVDDLDIHYCEDSKCSSCGVHTDGNAHQCTLNERDLVPPPLGLVAYDYETARRADGVHVAVCVCVSWVTFSDKFVENMREAAGDGEWRNEQFEVQRESYVGEDCTKRFCDDLFVNRRWLGHTVAAHNGSKFDAHFLLDEIIRTATHEQFKTVCDGTAVKCIMSKDKPTNRDSEGNYQLPQPKEVCIVDSYSMVPLTLRKACDAFAVSTPKTFFSFDRLDAWVRDGMDVEALQTNPTLHEYPEKDWENPDLAKHIADRDGKPFEFVKELTEYCQIDCDALLEVMRKFHDMFSAQSYRLGKQWLSPWAFMTGASAAYETWRMLAYHRDTEPLACSPNFTKSHLSRVRSVAVQWLSIEALHGGHINGVLDGDRVRVPGTKIFCDGRRGNTFYDMQYCGGRYKCQECSDSGVADVTYGANGLTRARSALTLGRRREIVEARGFQYVDARQCVFEREMRTSAERRSLRQRGLDLYKDAMPLDVRACYSGGRVEPGALYYKCKPDEILRSFDAVSLYPSVMTAKYDYPIGLPTKLSALQDFQIAADFQECVATQNIDRYFGLIRCKVLVDRERHHHPLISRHNIGTPNEKLTSSACSACGDKSALSDCEHCDDLMCSDCANPGPDTFVMHCPHVRCCSACQAEYLRAPCDHDDDERAFWMQCTTEEIKCAIREGDRLLEITEVHHFERRGNPMAAYIGHLYREKQAASKLPSEIYAASSPEERSRLIREYIDQINADSTRVFGYPFDFTEGELEYNEARRQVAKIMLNSFYGKFGTNPDKKEQSYITSANQLADLVSKYNSSLALDFIVTGAEKPVSIMSHTSVRANKVISSTTSIYVAIFVCAYGRLKLYNEALKPAGESALYWDTDSCLRIMKKTDPIPKCNGFLGDWEHEPEKDSVEFASLGPKTYTLALANGRSLSKCKGVNKEAASKTMSVDKFKDVLLNGVACITTKQQLWSRTHDKLDGDRGFRLRTTDDFARTTRFTSSKRMPCAPEIDDHGEVVAIMTKPFGYALLK